MTRHILTALTTAALLAIPASAQIQKLTPDGKPDLQGVWINPTLTPFERPDRFAGKATLTKAEMAQIEKAARERQLDTAPKAGDPGTYNAAWTDSGSTWLASGQTSLVVEPSNGRVPLKPSAIAQQQYDLDHVADSWEYQTTWDRCVTRGMPAGMFPAGYNNAYQIIQSPGYVTILSEMIHEVRVIPTDGRAHMPADARFWNGDSVGHWEGNALVVDTTNYNGKGMIATSAATQRVKGIHQSPALHVVERFQRVADGTLNYEVTITDPEMYTAPWKVSMPLTREKNYTIYEYACHEGNHAMVNILSGGRQADKAAKHK